MLKKTVTYKDFNGEEVKEDFFFHLSKAELIEMEMGYDGGLSGVMKRIIEAQDGRALVMEFKNIILSSYGQKSEDGRRFIKTPELREEFASSEAYSELFMELATNENSAAEFMNGIVPEGFIQDIDVDSSSEVTSWEKAKELIEQQESPTPPPSPTPRIISRREASEMPSSELTSGLVSGALKLADNDVSL